MHTVSPYKYQEALLTAAPQSHPGQNVGEQVFLKSIAEQGEGLLTVAEQRRPIQEAYGEFKLLEHRWLIEGTRAAVPLSDSTGGPSVPSERPLRVPWGPGLTH